MNNKTIIVGAGLSGLIVAYRLKQAGVEVKVLEALDRYGGRVFTSQNESTVHELGATWVFPQDHNLKKLMLELNVELFPQYLSGKAVHLDKPSKERAYYETNAIVNGAQYNKVVGGTSRLICALVEKIGKENIELNCTVDSVVEQEDKVEVFTKEKLKYTADKIVLTLPPRKLAATISFKPQLSSESSEIRKYTHTWMGDAIKVSLAFSKPFWRDQGMSGMAFTYKGAILELQDNVDARGEQFYLTGFLSPEFLAVNKNHVNDRIKEEINLLFPGGDKYLLEIKFCDWRKVATVSSNNLGLYPHQNNGLSALRKSEWNKKLWFAGAETSPLRSGYMEGAVYSAMSLINDLIEK